MKPIILTNTFTWNSCIRSLLYTVYIKMRNGYNILVGKSRKLSPLGLPRRICEDNIKHIQRDNVDWIQLAQNMI
jgi:hypothetical protein